MKIFHLTLHEFEALNKDHADQLLFQEKTFVKGDAFSKRVYERIVEGLRSEGDDSLSCLVVDMEGGYFVWREVQVPAEELNASPETSELNSNASPDSESDSNAIATLIALSIHQVVEEALTRKQVITLDQFTEGLKTAVGENAELLAERVFAKLEETGTIALISQFVEAEAESKKDASFPQRPGSRIYRGVSY